MRTGGHGGPDSAEAGTRKSARSLAILAAGALVTSVPVARFGRESMAPCPDHASPALAVWWALSLMPGNYLTEFVCGKARTGRF